MDRSSAQSRTDMTGRIAYSVVSFVIMAAVFVAVTLIIVVLGKNALP